MRATTAIIALSILLSPLVVRAQSVPSSVLFPAPLAPWKVSGTAGVTVTILPRPIAEEEIRQIPMADARVRLGLPYGVSLLASASTNVLTTSAAAGAEWSIALGKYSLAVGDRHEFWYGTAQIEGFDATALGWINHPFVTAGVDVKELRVLLRAEATYVLGRTTRVGDEEVATESNVSAGSAYTLAIEQPFIDATEVSLGVRVYVTDSAVQSWLAFSAFRDKLVYPELFFSVIL